MTKKNIKKVTTTTTVEYAEASTNEKTHIICILDRSGSMSSIMDDSIGGFNTFLKQQKELPDEATITVVLFDDTYEMLYDNVNIKKAKELTSKEWYPCGTTGLYDAIGKTINVEKNKLDKLGDEKPNKVLVCIVTDGYENASREYRIDDVKKLIKNCENDNWSFIYLAANQSAFDVGTSFGVSGGNTFTYTASTDGVNVMNTKLSNAATTYRGMVSNNVNFSHISKTLLDDEKIDYNHNTTDEK